MIFSKQLQKKPHKSSTFLRPPLRKVSPEFRLDNVLFVLYLFWIFTTSWRPRGGTVGGSKKTQYHSHFVCKAERSNSVSQERFSKQNF